MGLFGRKKQALLTEGVRGTAVIVRERRLDRPYDEGDTDISARDLGFGTYKFELELEVTLDDGRPPYPVAGTFKVPAKIGGESGPGVVLPVAVDPADPRRLEVDWDRFRDEGGAEAFKEAHQRKREATGQRAAEAATDDEARRLDAAVAAGTMDATEAEERKRLNAMSTAGELDDVPPMSASPREMLEWQRAKGLLDQATYDAIIANNPDMK